ncbi:phage tail-collar fiber domain-containing protein [Nitratidesulfovibrio vulgaris]|uniref:phage tail-collar fiber domain-containing protein n=1 Tax=Nitratidesulfovibrio vulgaris TaxID=881 RepID=UPI0023009E4C|nr:phage tail protein [Nitratidesulfovibrio vulgaris]WCB45220.1 phage tail protein [Nitratidesulfovibrio vulgaris]
MSVALTYAGESLIARLQAEGRPLTIDTFIFADVPGIDHTAPVNPGQGLPEGHEVYRFAIPAEYRAFVNPNQVVYSALLGSDIGPFTFNWQGLYCTEHATLVAVATFPRLEKRKYDPATNTQGNNLTRNFMLEFSGAREVTQVTVEAAVWQLDFSVRLKGMDERERLSNRDIYGRAAFLDDGWLLTRTADAYRFEAGRGYVEGIRAALAESLPAVPTVSPCDVWLDVSMQAEGSDVVTTVSPLFLVPGTASPDYTSAPPHNTRHHCEKVARIEADGTVVDLRPKSRDVLQQTLGVASAGHTHPLATEDAPGLAERATDAEAQAGSDTERYVTPKQMKDALGRIDLTAFSRDMRAGDIVMRGHTTIRTLDDGLPEALELNGDVVSLATFPRLMRVWWGDAQNATAPAFYRCNAGGTRDAAGTHLKLPDLRGYVPRGWDHGRGIDTGRVLASLQEDQNKSHQHQITNASNRGAFTSFHNACGRAIDGGSNVDYNNATVTTSYDGGSEARMRNAALMFIIYV